jgi:hypothetical protein
MGWVGGCCIAGALPPCRASAFCTLTASNRRHAPPLPRCSIHARTATSAQLHLHCSSHLATPALGLCLVCRSDLCSPPACNCTAVPTRCAHIAAADPTRLPRVPRTHAQTHLAHRKTVQVSSTHTCILHGPPSGPPHPRASSVSCEVPQCAAQK